MLNDPAADVVLGQRVLREHVASVYDTYSASTLTHLCFVAVFGAILYAQLHDPRLLFWMAGMVLADDLRLDNGMTYITAGTSLTREMIDSVMARVETPRFPLSEGSTVLIQRESSP